MRRRAAKRLRPHPESQRLVRALERSLVHLSPWDGMMYRATGIEYANRIDLVSGTGSMRHGARWTPRGSFRTVYGSLDPQTALLEAIGTGSQYGIPYDERMPLVMVAIDVRVARLLDMTLAAVRDKLRVSLDRMRNTDWEAEQQSGGEAVTQAVGRLAYEMDIEALLVPSARLAGQQNLVVFTDHLDHRAMRVQNVSKLPRPQARSR